MSTNYAKVKSNKWASDEDAGDLLAGILDETETAAQVEQSRLEAEMRAKEEEDRQRREEEARRKAQEAEQRLNAEQSRQQQLEQRRTARMEAIRIEDLKERGEWVDPAIEEAKRAKEAAEQAEALRQHQMQEQMLQMQQQMEQMRRNTPMPGEQAAVPAASQASSSKGPLIALAAVVAMVIAAGAILGVMMTQQYQPDATNYAKVTFAPKDSKDIVTVVGFTPLPKEEPVVAAVVEEPPAKKSSRRSSSRKSSSKSSAKSSSKATTKKSKGKFNISDDDLFGGGF